MELFVVRVVPQTSLELWRDLFDETIVQKLSHAAVQVLFDALQPVTFVRINLESSGNRLTREK